MLKRGRVDMISAKPESGKSVLGQYYFLLKKFNLTQKEIENWMKALDNDEE